MKNLTLKFLGSGVQSHAYFLSEEVKNSLEKGYVEGMSPWQFIQEYSSKTVNLSYGICVDSADLKIIARVDEGDEFEVERHFEDEWLDDEEEESEATGDAFIVSAEAIGHEPEGPSNDDAAVVLEFVRYQDGQVEITLDVEDDFSLSDIKLTFRSLDYDSDDFIRQWTYLEGKTIANNAEMELVGLLYKGEHIEFGGDRSFSSGEMELQYFVRDAVGELLWQHSTNVFDDE